MKLKSSRMTGVVVGVAAVAALAVPVVAASAGSTHHTAKSGHNAHPAGGVEVDTVRATSERAPTLRGGSLICLLGERTDGTPMDPVRDGSWVSADQARAARAFIARDHRTSAGTYIGGCRAATVKELTRANTALNGPAARAGHAYREENAVGSAYYVTSTPSRTGSHPIDPADPGAPRVTPFVFTQINKAAK